MVAEQLGHTLDVNLNVYTEAGFQLRKQAVNTLESALQSLNGVCELRSVGKLLKKLERETGIEPATSSLGTVLVTL